MGKVEDSPHFNEIVKMLSSGKGGTFVSKYLFDHYGEEISHATLNRYKKKNIRIDEQVQHELGNILEETVQEETDKQVEAENDKQLVAKKTAEQLQGLLDVTDDYPETVRKMESEADDPECNTTWKDVAKEKRNAKKLYLDYMKSQETNVEVNLNNNLSNFVDESEVMRFINESESTEQDSQ